MDEYYTRLKDNLCIPSVRRSLVISGENIGEEALLDGGTIIDSTLSFEKRDDNIEEQMSLPPTLVMFGAGHIARALYSIAGILGLKSAVFDDRAGYCSGERFPEARRYVMPFPDIDLGKYRFDNPYYIIFTHGHKADGICLRKVLAKGAAYIGMIGSRKKIAAVWNTLEEEGFERSLLDKVHSPIGLEIGAATAEEIAVAIMAEIVSTYRGDRNSVEADHAVLDALSSSKGGAVLCRIISKTGSGPGRKGAEMLVSFQACIGSIGGGALEEEVKRKALHMLQAKGKPVIADFDLSDEGSLGMACGGKASVLLKYLSSTPVME